MKSHVKVVDASFAYNGSGNVFENINFSIGKGEVLCILGPNGTGKTTLIKCLNRLLKLNSGDIFLKGENIYSLNSKDLARQIGYIPQGHRPVFPFKVLDVVLMGRAPHLTSLSSPSEADLVIAQKALEKLNIDHMTCLLYTSSMI